MKQAVQNENPERFNRLAAEWDQNPGRVALARAVAVAVRAAIPLEPTMRVLDFGAGTGLITLTLQDAVREVVAVDSSPEMLNVLQRKLDRAGLTNVKTLLLDIEQAPFPESGFDLLVSAMTLHHLRDPRLAFERFSQALRPNGLLAIADLDSEEGDFHADKTGVHHFGFDRERLIRDLSECGFHNFRSQTVHRIVRSDTAGQPRNFTVFLITASRI